MCGTTLRIFDPGIGGWRIIWNDPLNQDYSVQIGRAKVKEICPNRRWLARFANSMAIHRDHWRQLPLDRRGKIFRDRLLSRHVRTFGPPNKSI